MSSARAERLILAVVLGIAGAAADAADLGTLFHTPQEREQLDRLRRGEPEATKQAPAAPTVKPAKPSVTGFVRRSDGRHTVWIDGVPVPVAGPDASRLVESLSPGDAGKAREGVKIQRNPPR